MGGVQPPLSAVIGHNPFCNAPVDPCALNLFAGREEELARMRAAPTGDPRVLFIEGPQGVGKSSLGNYCRFEKESRGTCLSPEPEIEYEGDLSRVLLLNLWNALQALQMAVPSGRRDMVSYLAHEEKRILRRGADAASRFLGFALRGTARSARPFDQVHAVSTLKEFAGMAISLGFGEGIAFQIAVGEGRRISPSAIRSLMAPGIIWIITGPRGSGRELAESVENITWIDLGPLPVPALHLVIRKRLGGSHSPLSPEITEFLHAATDGDCGYTFHMLGRLFEHISRGQGLIQHVTLAQVLPLIISLARQDIAEKAPTRLAQRLLGLLARTKYLTTGRLASALKKKQASVSRTLSELSKKSLVTCHALGREHLYAACSAARLVFSDNARRNPPSGNTA